MKWLVSYSLDVGLGGGPLCRTEEWKEEPTRRFQKMCLDNPDTRFVLLGFWAIPGAPA
jgi:hypothetical protein